MAGERGQPPLHSRLKLLFWLFVAALSQALVAAFGVLSRYLQTHTQPPVPPLRLVVLVNIVGLATCLLIHALPLTLRHLWRRRRERLARQAAGLPSHAAVDVHLGAARTDASGADSVKAEKSELSRRSSDSGSTEWHNPADAGQQEQPPAGPAQPLDGHPLHSVPSESGTAAAADHAAPEQRHPGLAAAPPADEEAGGGPGPKLPPPTRLKSTVRPSLPLERGMSARFERLEQRRPALYRTLALAALTTAFACGFVGQISAPGLVDPSIVQLVSLFQVVFIALVQAALLRHKLPWALWPAAALMIGGAAMVIVPSMSQSASGSLNSAKGWAGFGLSIVSMWAAVVFLIVTQATRHLGFNPWNCQYLYMGVTLVLLLCLSLPINGTNWGEDLAGWTAADWSVLALLGSVINIGTNLTIQHAIWQLGAPTVAMFVGLRLVCAVVLSKIILGATTIKTAVQVVGICLTAAAVTAYMAWQWKRSAKPAPSPGTPEPEEEDEPAKPEAAGTADAKAADAEAAVAQPAPAAKAPPA